MEEDKLKGILGKNIKFFRLRRQFSQADLAEKANISITFLSNIERGNNYPQAGTLCSIVDALGIEAWELFRETGNFNEQNAIINRISSDYKKQVNIALETVHKKYSNKS
ncbi:MAG: helix-turn-helix domain-containing protein [Treponema sp.]|nr:helix-turn-helix domain-containing protein [Treponema sp.]